MKTIAIGLSAMALVLSGGAYAAQGQGPRGADADGNGVVTRAEAQTKASARFAKMDRNHDGKIDRADRQLAREERKTKVFARLDTNGDGQISKAEFMADQGPRGGGRMAMAGTGDSNGASGKRGWGGRGRGHHGGMMMAKMADADHDGVITQPEFTDAAMKRFDAVDANKDGQITQAERQAAHEQMKAKWQQLRAQRAQG